MWKRLEHDNVVPLLGITTTPLQLISKWMTGGTLTEYIEKHPDASRLGHVGARLDTGSLTHPTLSYLTLQRVSTFSILAT